MNENKAGKIKKYLLIGGLVLVGGLLVVFFFLSKQSTNANANTNTATDASGAGGSGGPGPVIINNQPPAPISGGGSGGSSGGGLSGARLRALQWYERAYGTMKTGFAPPKAGGASGTIPPNPGPVPAVRGPLPRVTPGPVPAVQGNGVRHPVPAQHNPVNVVAFRRAAG